jgi:hypothetical protein
MNKMKSITRKVIYRKQRMRESDLQKIMPFGNDPRGREVQEAPSTKSSKAQ